MVCCSSHKDFHHLSLGCLYLVAKKSILYFVLRRSVTQAHMGKKVKKQNKIVAQKVRTSVKQNKTAARTNQTSQHSHLHTDLHINTHKHTDLWSVMHGSVCRTRPVSGLDSGGLGEINRKLRLLDFWLEVCCCVFLLFIYCSIMIFYLMKNSNDRRVNVLNKLCELNLSSSLKHHT